MLFTYIFKSINGSFNAYLTNLTHSSIEHKPLIFFVEHSYIFLNTWLILFNEKGGKHVYYITKKENIVLFYPDHQKSEVLSLSYQ